MFNGNPKNGVSLSNDITNYIEGFDIFNSSFIYYLDRIKLDPITITKYPERLDLLSSITTYGMNGVKNRVMSPTDIQVGNKFIKIDNSDIISILGDVSHGG